MWYNPFYSIVQFRVTTLRYRPKEAVPIEPKQQRHISTDGVKTTAGATGQPGAPAPKNKKKPKKRRSIIGMIFSFIGCMLCLCIMAASVGGVLLSMYIVQVTADDAETLDLDNQKNRQTSIVYDINGNEYASLSRNENRIWRELSAMPENLQNAVIAIEDKNFRTEPGINLKGTIGAALNAFTGNRIWGTNRGASTLEQQLIKNLTGDNEQDNMRKVREIFRALGLDNKYSKETILEAYLNTIPLTGIIHGMEAGSIEYFGKHVEDLTLAECATLASITKNPTKYNPATNPEELIKRRNHVLYEMYTQGYITEAEFNAAKAETVTLTEKTSTTENATRSSSNSWFTDAMITDVAEALVEKLGITEKVNSEGKKVSAYDQAINMVYSRGYKIYTTQNPKYQKIAEDVCYNLENIPYTSSYTNAAGEQVEDQLQIALTIVDPTNGYVVAMIGGAGEKVVDRGWNWAVNARQCGSAIKPVSTYAPALDDGTINGASVIDDYPMLLNGEVWPRNANWRYQGLTALHTAIAQSLNTCAVRTNLAYGVSNSYDFLVDKLGFENLTYTDSQQVGNMALGGFEKGVTTEEMSAAYAAFVNEGVYTKPRTFIRVEDANGNVVLENEAQSTVAMKNTTAAIINHLLQEAALNGTGYEAQFSGMHIAGKTGSTNSNKDRYFAGYTPYYSCAVWAGYEHNQRIVASGNPCSAVFRKVMSAIHEDLPDKNFFSCSGLTSVAVCADSGMLASENCALDVRGSRVYTALVAADNAPTAVCTMHTAPTYTVNMAESDGNVTTVTGSVLNYQRELIEGHDEIVVEDAFMMLGGWNGFFGDEADDDFNMPDGDHDDTTDPDNMPDTIPDYSDFIT